MKKSLAALCLLATTAAHAECRISSTFGSNIDRASKAVNWTGWDVPDAEFAKICKKLNAANARLIVNGNAVVLANTSIGWSMVSVADKDLSISPLGAYSQVTKVDANASQHIADRLMMESVSQTLRSWDGLDQALSDLEKRRSEAKAALQPPKK